MLFAVFILFMVYFYVFFIKKAAVKNYRRRKSIKVHNRLIEEEEGKGLGELIDELDFALTTMDCNKSIEAIRTCIIQNEQLINLFFAINEISACFNNHFAIIGNFVGNEISPDKNHNQSMGKLFSAEILLRKNADNTLSLLSTLSEDKNRDFFIKNFIIRIKEILQ